MRSPLERRHERRAARRYFHKVAAWRPCYRGTRIRLCLRCLTREVLGINRRARAAEIARHQAMREVFAAPSSFPPMRMKRAPRRT